MEEFTSNILISKSILEPKLLQETRKQTTGWLMSYLYNKFRSDPWYRSYEIGIDAVDMGFKNNGSN